MCRLEKVFKVQQTDLPEGKISLFAHFTGTFSGSAHCILETLWFPVHFLISLCGRIQMCFDKSCANPLTEHARWNCERIEAKYNPEFADIPCVSFFDALEKSNSSV